MRAATRIPVIDRLARCHVCLNWKGFVVIMARVFGQYVWAEMLGLWAFEIVGCFVIMMTTSGHLGLLTVPHRPSILHLTAANSAILAVALSLSCVAVGLYRPSAVLSTARLLPLTVAAGLSMVPLIWMLAVAETIDLRILIRHPDQLARLIVSWVALIVVTRLIYAAGVRSGLLVREVLVVGDGAGDGAGDLSEAIGPGMRSLFRIRASETTHAVAPEPLGPMRIVLSPGGLSPSALPAAWSGRFTRVFDPSTFWERHLGRIDLDGACPDGVRADALPSRAVRRALDLVVASLLLLLLAPLMAMTAVAIRFESPGPVIYRQRRIGLGGRPFTILKFRSMRNDAERDGVAVFARVGDSRTTRIGRFIRRVRIDELPQLVNVLRGEMAVVGPRPERPDFVERYRRVFPSYDLRHEVRPGLTGWAQVNSAYTASDAETREKLSYDLYYVRHRSIALDLAVMVSTVRVILFQVGSR